MKRCLLSLCAVLLAGSAGAPAALAQPSVLGNSFPVFGAASRGSAVAYDSRNHVYLVVSAYGAVHARFVSADGVGLPNCVSSGSSFILGGESFGHFPRVAYSPDAAGGMGGFVVTWHESAGGGNVVHARAVSYTGCLGPDNVISFAGSWWEAGAAIAYSTASQRFLVSWATAGPPNDIHGRLLDPSGTPLGPGPFAITSTDVYESNPSVAYNPAADQFLVSFAGGDSSAFVAARLVGASTGAVGAQYELTRTGGTYITDATFMTASGKFMVAWHQLPGGATGRLVGANGVPEGSPVPLSARFTAYDAMSLDYNPVSGTAFLVSQDQLSFENGGFEISATGVPSGGFGATSIGARGNYYPRIAASTADRRWLMVTSQDFHTIYGQFVVTGSSGGGVAPPVPQAAALRVTALTPSVALPVTEGTPITWTAAASGGTGALQYQFMRYTEGIGWSVAQAYSSSTRYTWFPPAGLNAVQIWVRNGGSSATYDAVLGTGGFTVLAATPRLASLTPNVAFPVSYNVPVTFTAAATGGPGPLQYKFVTYSATGGWAVGQDYSSSRTFTWFPPQGINALQVWVRAAGSGASYQDWMGTSMFAVAATPARMTGFAANFAFPASPMTTFTWTAFATGGGGPLEYRFVRYDQGANAWSVLQDWSGSNQASWTPGVGNSGWHVVQAWVRTVGSNVAWEDWRGTDHFLVTTSTGVSLTPNRSLNGLRVGNLVTWTANISGGQGPWEYKFLTHDFRGWIVQQDYSTLRTFSWYPAAGTSTMQVWIRAAGSHALWERYASSGFFVVNP